MSSDPGSSTGGVSSSSQLSGMESLRSAIDAGLTERVIELLKLGLPIVVDSDGQTALHLAASAGHLEMVEALIQAGCDVGIQDFTGHTALQRASAEGHLEIIKTLVKNGVSVDHQDEVHGNTALHEASWKGFSQSVHYLCRSKANPYIKNRGGFAPLHLCCQNGHNETCRVLLLSGCRPDIKNNYGDTPLHTAARYGHAGVIRILVSAKCDTSEQNKNGDTSLHISAAMGRRKLTRVLLESGCDREMKNKQNETAAEIAKRKSLAEIVQILKSTEASISINPSEKYEQLGKSVDDSADDVDAIRVVGKSYNPNNQEHQRRPVIRGARDRSSTSSRERQQQHRKKDKRDLIKGKDHKSKRREGGGGRHHHRRQPREFSPYQDDTIAEAAEVDGEQYYMDLAGNIRRGPAPGSRGAVAAAACHGHCNPIFSKFERKLEKDKRDLIKVIDHSHERLDSRLAHLEKRTKEQVFHLNQTMKESFAQERGECLDRMDRRALRERIAIERQQLVRDMALKRDLAGWLDAKLTEIERRHSLDEKNSALLRAMAVKRFSKYSRATAGLLSSGRPGTLRRAHSEELMSEVGVANNNGNNSDDIPVDNGDLYNSYKGLQVSDRPSVHQPTYASMGRGRRVRRNSAGDEISSILNHETTTVGNNGLGNGLDNGLDGLNGLVVMASPLAAFNTRDLAHPYHHHVHDEAELRMAALASAQDQHDLSSITSSSLNTTVITKLEVSDRSMVMNNRETSPEQRLDLVVCDQQQAYPADATAEQYYQNGHYRLDHPGVIRPIPGRPGGGGGGGRYQNGPPPVPGPKPVLNYLKNDQYRGMGMDTPLDQYSNGGPTYDPSLGLGNGLSNGLGNGLSNGLVGHYGNKELNGVQRQLFPESSRNSALPGIFPPASALPQVNHCTEVYNVHEVTSSNGKLGNGGGKHNFGPFSYMNGGFTNGYPRPTSNLKPMLAPLEEVDYTSHDQIAHMNGDAASSHDGLNGHGSQGGPDSMTSADLHRQLLNIPMTSEGSHDSHNDSGYSTRLGFSAGPSPSLSGSRPESSEGGDPPPSSSGTHPSSSSSGPPQSVAAMLLDPQAISMMPPELENPLSPSPDEVSAMQDLMQRTSLEEEQEAVLSGPKGSLV